MRDKHMLGAAQHIEEAQREPDLVAAANPPASGARSPAAGTIESKVTLVALHPGCAAIAHQDLPVGEWIRFCSAFPALALARRSHPSYHLGPNRATFGFIAVEQALRSCHKTLDDRPLGGRKQELF
jgi:hypothetical protein